MSQSSIPNDQPNPVKIAILANSNLDLMDPLLRQAFLKHHIPSDILLGGFNQYAQEILDPTSKLYQYSPGFVILYLGGDELFRELLDNPFISEEQRIAIVKTKLDELYSLCCVISERLPEAIVILNTIVLPPINCLNGLEYNSKFSLHDVQSLYNEGLIDLRRRFSSVIILDTQPIIGWIGYKEWFDPRLYILARIRLSRKALEYLSIEYVRLIASRLGLMKKCVVIDLDNTVWGGVIGEDGFNGIKLGDEGLGLAFGLFQRELLKLHRKGVLLAICSKNNLNDALEVIKKHPSMVLREEHFSSMRINWDDKATNIRSIAEELNIGLDSLVFIDDNPVERDWVSNQLSEVSVPNWPSDPAYFCQALLDVENEYFKKLVITQEDFMRNEFYQAQASRNRLQSSAVTIEEFYYSLKMKAIIRLANQETLPRIAQLTQKTNQFNLTTRRYTEMDIASLLQSSGNRIYSLELIDRFGSNGIVGVLILKSTGNCNFIIDTFLLSCRVMGRTVENAFIGFVSQEEKKQGAMKIIGEFRATAKNMAVADLYRKLGFQFIEAKDSVELWEYELEKEAINIPEWIEVDKE